MDNAGYLRYRSDTPMVLLRPLGVLQSSDKSNSTLFEFDWKEQDKQAVRWLPRRLITIWKYQERGENVLEIELPQWLAREKGLIK